MADLTKSMAPEEIADLERLEIIIERTSGGFIQCGNALEQIKEFRLYRKDYDTFEAYCQERWGFTRIRAHQLIKGAVVAKGLTKDLLTMVNKERPIRELSKSPPQDRSEVIKTAHKNSNGAVTAKSIKAAVAVVAAKKADPIIILDEVGWPIPETVIAVWDKAKAELGAILSEISSARSAVRKAMDSKSEDLVWRHCSPNSVMVALDNAYREINAGIPYAVCPYCQGKLPKSCSCCKQTGFIGKFNWTTAIPKELRAMREAARDKK